MESNINRVGACSFFSGVGFLAAGTALSVGGGIASGINHHSTLTDELFIASGAILGLGVIAISTGIALKVRQMVNRYHQLRASNADVEAPSAPPPYQLEALPQAYYPGAPPPYSEVPLVTQTPRFNQWTTSVTNSFQRCVNSCAEDEENS